MDRLDRAIETTRNYGRKFGVEYGKRQIRERLISATIFKKDKINTRLKELRVKSFELTNKEKVEKAEKLAKLIARNFKDILMIGITGSVAAGYPAKESDIDLMIITKRDRLWLTRLLMRMFILVKQIPHRKFGLKEKNNDFCFNLWMEEDTLLLPDNRCNLRNAMDAMLMIPILDRDNIHKKFLIANNWIKNYLVNSYVDIIK